MSTNKLMQEELNRSLLFQNSDGAKMYFHNQGCSEKDSGKVSGKVSWELAENLSPNGTKFGANLKVRRKFLLAEEKILLRLAEDLAAK